MKNMKFDDQNISKNFRRENQAKAPKKEEENLKERKRQGSNKSQNKSVQKSPKSVKMSNGNMNFEFVEDEIE